MKDKEIHISFIQDFPSVQEGIFYLTDITKTQLKRYHLSKNFLQKPIRQKDEISFPLNLINHKKINPCYEGSTIRVICEDELLIALSKPHKIHSHPLKYGEQDNVLSGLLSMGRNKELEVNKMSYDRGLLYRLDYETSGLMIYIKNESELLKLRDDFQNIIKKKIYLAVVSGDLQEKKLSHKLKPSGPKGSKMVPSDDGILNEIEIEKLEYNKAENLSLVKVFLGHGHRHQIRAQLSCAGYPILGDELYGNKKSSRLYLHSFIYEFEYNGKAYKLKDESYDELANFFSSDCKL